MGEGVLLKHWPYFPSDGSKGEKMPALKTQETPWFSMNDTTGAVDTSLR